MNRTRHRILPRELACLLAITIPSAVAANDAYNIEAEGVADNIEAEGAAEFVRVPADPPAESSSSISIESPTGQVAISQAGDSLGEVRYGSRDGDTGITVVRFTSTGDASLFQNSSALALPGQIPVGLPVDGAVLTSGFGPRLHPTTGEYRRHGGVDLAVPHGTPVKATMEGVVLTAGWMGNYGITVRIDHGSAVETRYAHMSKALVAPGQRVARGQTIGLAGSTGRSTGPHVHYEIRSGRVPVDPLP